MQHLMHLFYYFYVNVKTSWYCCWMLQIIQLQKGQDKVLKMVSKQIHDKRDIKQANYQPIN